MESGERHYLDGIISRIEKVTEAIASVGVVWSLDPIEGVPVLVDSSQGTEGIDGEKMQATQGGCTLTIKDADEAFLAAYEEGRARLESQR